MHTELIQLHDYTMNILCPICQHAIIDWQEEQYIQPCAHTLFIAMDLGFEFISDRFELKMKQKVDELHEDPNMNILSSILETPYPQMTLIQNGLGVNDLNRYVGISPE